LGCECGQRKREAKDDAEFGEAQSGLHKWSASRKPGFLAPKPGARNDNFYLPGAIIASSSE
jgi:hypothetical protein